MNSFSRVIINFHDRKLPEPGYLVGYAALIEAYQLKVPLPETCSIIAQQHKKYKTDTWAVYTPRYTPQDTQAGHLTFALKYEGVDLAILNALFARIDPTDIITWIRNEPTGQYSRRIWFLYEWLTNKKLDLEDSKKIGNFVDVIDAKQQYPGPSKPSSRHRVRNNLPGVRDFCPLIRCTEKLTNYINLHLGARAHEEIKYTSKDLLSRASAFLLLKDSRASFQIEHENPAHSLAERWGQVVGQAGQKPLTKDEILRLQTIVLEKNRFIEFGFRTEGGFIGIHDRETGVPIPDHISARCSDLDRLMDGLLQAYHHVKNSSFDPILLAASIAFGFVFIHPLVDGNGRIHRYIIQHVLAECEFVPKGIVFPIAAVILEHINSYVQVLQSYSHPRLSCIEWKPTEHGNVDVQNQTIDLYRYFDATKQAEFLYECMMEAINTSFPAEIEYLQHHDRMKAVLKERFSMPDKLINLLIRLLTQNNGILSKKATKMLHEFESQELQDIEVLYSSIFKTKK